MKKVAIIGGGAAGFFTAINLAERRTDLEITIFEAQNKLLSKVLVSGGGRCNVTNQISAPKELSKFYPRGHEVLQSVFEKFSSNDTQRWFTDKGVALKTEADGRVFPQSNSSQSIYNCLTQNAKKLGVNVNLKHRLKDLKKVGEQWKLRFDKKEEVADIVVIASGSSAAIWKILDPLGLKIIEPVPSLFTFKTTNNALKDLSGVSVENVEVTCKSIPKQSGPILITHQGLSGPAILKVSAWGARELQAKNYNFQIQIDWIPHLSKDQLLNRFKTLQQTQPKTKVLQWKEHELPKRLWNLVFESSELREFTNWSEIGKKGINRLFTQLKEFQVEVNGKNTFKEEFVTAGGVDLACMDLECFVCKDYSNLYLAGEVLNIDAVTGGFNFQAAWSAAYLISQSI